MKIQRGCAFVEEPLCGNNLETASEAEVACGLRASVLHEQDTCEAVHVQVSDKDILVCLPFYWIYRGDTG